MTPQLSKNSQMERPGSSRLMLQRASQMKQKKVYEQNQSTTLRRDSRHKEDKGGLTVQDLVQTQQFLKHQIHLVEDENVKLTTKTRNLDTEAKKIEKSLKEGCVTNQIQRKSKYQLFLSLKTQLKQLDKEEMFKKEDL